MANQHVETIAVPLYCSIAHDNTPSQALMEYLYDHRLLPATYESLPREAIAGLRAQLQDREEAILEKKRILMLLAHHGSPEALEAVRSYCDDPDEPLVDWSKHALEEAQVWAGE